MGIGKEIYRGLAAFTHICKRLQAMIFFSDVQWEKNYMKSWQDRKESFLYSLLFPFLAMQIHCEHNTKNTQYLLWSYRLKRSAFYSNQAPEPTALVRCELRKLIIQQFSINPYSKFAIKSQKPKQINIAQMLLSQT